MQTNNTTQRITMKMKPTAPKTPVEIKPKEYWKDVDEDWAKFFLEYNADHQRPLNQRHVDFLAKEMA